MQAGMTGEDTMDQIVSKMKDIVGEENVLVGEPMSAHTTFKIGGPADCFVRPHTNQEVCDVVKACHEAGVPLHVIGNGSDLLVADAGLRGVVMQITDNMANILIPNADNGFVFAGAGVTNADLAERACEEGLAGYEFACGIPGTVGGASIMNAGAYDHEFKEVCEQVICVTPEGNIVPVPRGESRWAYRHSKMDDFGYIVLSAQFRFKKDDKDAIRARMDDYQARRAAKQPLDMPSAGSTFKRPEGHFAGQLIEEAGLKGYTVGGAQVSEKHSGFVVNANNATAADVRQLISDVQEKVKATSGVQLEPEVRFWGFDEK
jgi:UDP-N-acetylmuramate dehydrogenase